MHEGSGKVVHVLSTRRQASHKSQHFGVCAFLGGGIWPRITLRNWGLKPFWKWVKAPFWIRIYCLMYAWIVALLVWHLFTTTHNVLPYFQLARSLEMVIYSWRTLFLLRALLHLIFNYLRPKNHKTYIGVFMMATFFLLACRKTNSNNFARICVFPIIVKCGLHIFLPSIIFPKKKTRTFGEIRPNDRCK